MGIILPPVCKKCGKRPVEKMNGLPTMLGFKTKDGKMINVCCDCIMELGRLETQEEKDEFFESIGC